MAGLGADVRDDLRSFSLAGVFLGKVLEYPTYGVVDPTVDVKEESGDSEE